MLIYNNALKFNLKGKQVAFKNKSEHIDCFEINRTHTKNKIKENEIVNNTNSKTTVQSDNLMICTQSLQRQHQQTSSNILLFVALIAAIRILVT